MDLKPLPELAREEGRSVRVLKKILGRIPGALLPKEKNEKYWVNMSLVSREALRSAHTSNERFNLIEADVHDLKLRMIDVEAKVA